MHARYLDLRNARDFLLSTRRTALPGDSEQRTPNVSNVRIENQPQALGLSEFMPVLANFSSRSSFEPAAEDPQKLVGSPFSSGGVAEPASTSQSLQTEIEAAGSADERGNKGSMAGARVEPRSRPQSAGIKWGRVLSCSSARGPNEGGPCGVHGRQLY